MILRNHNKPIWVLTKKSNAVLQKFTQIKSNLIPAKLFLDIKIPLPQYIFLLIFWFGYNQSLRYNDIFVATDFYKTGFVCINFTQNPWFNVGSRKFKFSQQKPYNYFWIHNAKIRLVFLTLPANVDDIDWIFHWIWLFKKNKFKKLGSSEKNQAP